MLNPEQMLGQLLGGALSGAMRSKPRKNKGSWLGTGAQVQVGLGLVGLAIAAYEHYQGQRAQAATPQGQPATATPPPLPASSMPPPLPTAGAPALPAVTDQQRQDMLLLVQAMVAAAAADGDIDAQERAGILQRVAQQGDGEARAFLERELANPKSLAAVVAATRPELAQEVYAVSHVAICADNALEHAYLDALAARLNIDPADRQRIHERLATAA